MMPLQAPAPASRFLDGSGTRLHLLSWQGAGPPLLIVHGNTHAGGVYEPLALRLSDRFQVNALDLRGHGLSGQPGYYGWDALRDDIAGVIDMLAAPKVSIVAHSRGAGACLLAAGARRDKVDAMVVFEPTLPPGAADPEISAVQRSLILSARLEKAGKRRTAFASREDTYAHYHGRGAFKHWEDDYLRAFVKYCLVERDGQFMLASSTEVEGLLVAARQDSSAWAGLGKVNVPLLAVYGESSGRLGEDGAAFDFIRSHFPLARLHVMRDASHSGPMEHPHEFEMLIRAFSDLHRAS